MNSLSKDLFCSLQNYNLWMTWTIPIEKFWNILSGAGAKTVSLSVLFVDTIIDMCYRSVYMPLKGAMFTPWGLSPPDARHNTEDISNRQGG